MKKTTLPPHISLEDDTTFGSQFSAVAGDYDDLSPNNVAALLSASDRKAYKKELGQGFHPVLLVDIESGLSAIEMRKWERQFPQKPTKAQLKLRELWLAAQAAEIELKRAVIALNDEQRRAGSSKKKAA